MSQVSGMRRFHSLSLGDSEPGLFTYAQIVYLLKTEFARARRYGHPLACFVIRIDRLDRLKDLYGYKAKDFILEKVVSLLRRESRSCDFLGKAPDDQLLMVVPHTNEEGAKIFSGRLRDAISAFDFEVEGKAIKVTVSVGVSTYANRNTLFYDAVIYAAEESAEEAARAGGDSVVYKDPLNPSESDEEDSLE